MITPNRSFSIGSLSPQRSQSPSPFPYHNQQNHGFSWQKLLLNSTNFRALLLIIATVCIHTMVTWNWFQLGSSESRSSMSTADYLNSHSHNIHISDSLDHLSALSRDWLLAQLPKAREKSSMPLLTTSDDFVAFDVSNVNNLWDLAPPLLSCPDLERVGKVGEGGKWVCGLSYLSRLPNCVMYSYGISSDVSFEYTIAQRTNCTIHAFDPTIGQLPYSKLAHELGVPKLDERITQRIAFHKVALGTHSADTSSFPLTETLHDAMQRLGHSHLHLLKVDVEGAEWGVFTSLHEYLQQSRKSLSVGQLLIELHHESVARTRGLFSQLRDWDLLAFSRELNLQPAIAGHKPFACEYSFVNPQLFYAPPASTSISSSSATSTSTATVSASKDLGAKTPTDSQGSRSSTSATQVQPKAPLQLVNNLSNQTRDALWTQPLGAVIYFLSRRKRLDLLCSALQSLYVHVWRDYSSYATIVIFHDDFTAVDQAHLQRKCVPHMPLRFEYLQFRLPQTLHAQQMHVPARTTCDPQASTVGYRHMCRFHAYAVHDLLQSRGFVFRDPRTQRLYRKQSKRQSKGAEEVEEIDSVFEIEGLDEGRSGEAREEVAIDYIMRLDDDSTFSAPIGYDLFRYLLVNQRRYAFTNLLPDDRMCVRGLWDLARTFLRSHRLEHLLVDQSNSHSSGSDRGGAETMDDDLSALLSSTSSSTSSCTSPPQNTSSISHLSSHLLAHNLSSAQRHLFGSTSGFFASWPDPMIFYNNLEISEASLWLHPLWRAFAHTVEHSGGIYLERWGDAPLHTLGISLLLSRSEVHAFRDIAYTHKPFVQQTATGLGLPQMDAFLSPYLRCDFYATWTCVSSDAILDPTHTHFVYDNSHDLHPELRHNLSLLPFNLSHSYFNLSQSHFNLSQGYFNWSSSSLSTSSTLQRAKVLHFSHAQSLAADEELQQTATEAEDVAAEDADIDAEDDERVFGEARQYWGVFRSHDRHVVDLYRRFALRALHPSVAPPRPTPSEAANEEVTQRKSSWHQLHVRHLHGHQHTPSLTSSLDPKKAVLFTFAHVGREHLLAHSLASALRHYALPHATPVLVFYDARRCVETEGLPLDIWTIKRLLLRSQRLRHLLLSSTLPASPASSSTASTAIPSSGSEREDQVDYAHLLDLWLYFQPVHLSALPARHTPATPPRPPPRNTSASLPLGGAGRGRRSEDEEELEEVGCRGSDNEEVRRAGVFLRGRALRYLHQVLGFDYLVRIGDDSRFRHPVPQPLPHLLARHNQTLAYLDAIATSPYTSSRSPSVLSAPPRAPPSCGDLLWSLADDLVCKDAKAAGDAADEGSRCGALRGVWRRDASLVTNLAVYSASFLTPSLTPSASASASVSASKENACVRLLRLLDESTSEEQRAAGTIPRRHSLHACLLSTVVAPVHMHR